MIRATRVIFCDNEHGTGNITFPSLEEVDAQTFIEPRTIAELRKEAKKAGWGRVNGADYCDTCMEGAI